MGEVHHRIQRCLWRLLWFALPLLLPAAENDTVLGPGASREHVIRTFGAPTGQTKADTREILSYPHGRVILNHGLVERLEFKPNVAWPSAGRSSNRVAMPVANPRPPPDPRVWQTDFDEATAAAMRRNANILAVFTGTDWQAGDDSLMEDVLRHPEFARVFAPTYVFFHAELASAGASAAQHQQLRERYGITVFPAMLMLSPSGEKLARIEVGRAGDGGSYRARVFGAVRETHDLLGFAPLPAVRKDFLAPAETTAAKGSPSAVAGLFSSASLALQALAVGVGVALVLFWLVWRDWVTPPPQPKPLVVSARIDDAASGLPTCEEIVAWPREKVRAVAQRLAEGDGFRVETQAKDSDRDLVLRREGEDHPRAYVCCSSGDAGIVTVRRVRELFGLLTADGVATGWFYAPSGFAAEARAFAARHRLTLVDAHGLHARLRDLGPLALGKVVGQRG